MRSHPVPLLAFDRIGAEQRTWDRAIEVHFNTAIAQPFHCASDGLHRIEIFITESFHLKRCHLWLLLFENHSPTGFPLRVVGPLATEQLSAHGWLAFEFEPVVQSANRNFTLVLQSPDGTPGNALAVRGSNDGIAFRAACLQAPALWSNFQRYRAGARARNATVDYNPLMVRLEISRPCNLHCVMCHRGLNPFDARREGTAFLAPETFRRLDPILPDLLRVIAFGLGEPFLNPRYLEILRHLRTRNPFAHVFTSTNGTCLSDDAIDAVLDERLLSEIQISLDGAERETFEAIRKNASFDTVRRSFSRLAAARARRHNHPLHIRAAMLVMKPNLRQITAFIREMAEVGVDWVSLDTPKDAAFRPLRADSDSEMAEIFDHVAEAHDFLSARNIELCGPLLSELLAWRRRTAPDAVLPCWGLDGAAHLISAVTTNPPACGVPWESFRFAADGTVRVCCNSNRAMGRVEAPALAELWQRAVSYQGLRGELLSRSLHQDCRTCLGENVAMPDSIAPAVLLHGTVEADARAKMLTRIIGRRIDIFAAATASDVRAELHDTPCEPTSRLHGWLCPTNETPAPPTVRPRVIAVAVDGIVRAMTLAAKVSAGNAPWSASLETAPYPLRHRELVLLEVEGDSLRRIRTERVRPGLPRLAIDSGVHGFIDRIVVGREFACFIGWARDTKSRTPAHRVSLLVDGRPVATVLPWLPRPDVAAAYGDSATHHGFLLELPLGSVPPGKAPTLDVFATNTQGAGAALEWSPAALASARAFGVPDNALAALAQAGNSSAMRVSTSELAVTLSG
jgi:MoaA/NifB/PqqE/SkfB family radical SAM enzyme